MGLRETIAIKRIELSIMEADIRIEDLQAEIERVKDKKSKMKETLKQLNSEMVS